MSIEATRWAYSQVTGSSARKSVLASMADRCGDDNTCYPSIPRLAKDTELNEKTVRKAIHELCELGFIVWTGETKGMGAKVYKLAVSNHETTTNFGSTNFTTPTNFGTTKNGSHPLPKTDVPPTNFGSDPLPILGGKPINEPIINLSSEHINEKNRTHTHETQNFQNQNNQQSLVSEKSISESQFQDNGNKSSEVKLGGQSADNAKVSKKSDQAVKPPVKANDLIDLGVSPQVAHDFLRKKKNHEITHTALARNQSQAAKASLSLHEALEFTVEKDWQAFTADYYFNAIRKQSTSSQVNYHANHQPVTTQQQPSHTTYGNDLMGQIAREIGATSDKSVFDDGHRGNVYDMEAFI